MLLTASGEVEGCFGVEDDQIGQVAADFVVEGCAIKTQPVCHPCAVRVIHIFIGRQRTAKSVLAAPAVVEPVKLAKGALVLLHYFFRLSFILGSSGRSLLP